MSAVGDAIAAEALGWVGTPSVWLGACKGVGCDCKGLVAGVARACGRPEGDSIEALARDYRGGDERRLIAGLARLFDPVRGVLELGDVLLLIVGGAAQHLAIVTRLDAGGGPLRITHVHPGLRMVREVPARRDMASVHSAWRWRP